MISRFVGKLIFGLGLLLLAYALAGNYVALPGFRNYMARGGTSAAGNTVDFDVIVGAIKTIVWLFSFQLGVTFTVICAKSKNGMR
jgi:hypothetical protein